MSLVEIKNLEKSYWENSQLTKVLGGLNLVINPGEFVSIFGPNGSGKTTLLNLIAGLDKEYSGHITFPKTTKIAYIFQNYREAIFRWLTVGENISYPLYLKGIPKELRQHKVLEMCKQFDIQFDLNAYPYTLSGGQQQLVSILRGLVTEPDIILMDEPFSSLDYQTTLFMMEKIQEIWQKTGTSIVFVSHDIDEAVLLAQKIVVLTQKPTTVANIIPNPLPYPRTAHVVGTHQFAQLKHQVLDSFVAQLKVREVVV